MKVYKLEWDDEAKIELIKIWEYFLNFSTSTAKRITEDIDSYANKLTKNPLIGQKEEILENYRLGYRYLVCGNYKIVYRVIDDSVFILTVFDTRQNPSKLEDLLKK